MIRKTTVYFHKTLQKYTDGYSEFTSEGDSYVNIVRNCIRMFPKLEKAFKIIATRNINEELVLIENRKLVPFENLLLPPKKDTLLILCPVIGGGGGDNILSIVALVVIVVILIFAPELFFTVDTVGVGVGGATGATATAASVGAVGTVVSVTFLGQIAIGLFINIVIALATPTPKAIVTSGGRATRNNDAYEGLVNTSSTSIPVPLNYGHLRVAGHLISGYTKTIDHGESDIVEVKDYL